jgi:hypothetical protein
LNEKSQFLNVIQANDSIYLDLEARDQSGSTLLEHVVRRGTGSEVEALLTLGAELIPQDRLCSTDGNASCGESPDPWKFPESALSQAISHDNLSTFDFLLSQVPRHQINSVYTAGPNSDEWTMLHFAAYLGRDEIVKRLLKAGAQEFYVNLEEELEKNMGGLGQENSPRLFFTYDTHKRYLQALLDSGKIDKIAADDEEDEFDIFWDVD